MQTETKEYHEYLENKYLPGRSIYLKYFFYPKIIREFIKNETIIDLGCGVGGFLEFCKNKKIACLGIDSNESLINQCLSKGLDARIDNIINLESFKGQPFANIISDNVLEHLSEEEIKLFFAKLDSILIPEGIFVCIVPGVKGYKKDPTHKTFITQKLLERIIENTTMKIKKNYYHPINMAGIDNFFYLNMHVYILNKK